MNLRCCWLLAVCLLCSDQAAYAFDTASATAVPLINLPPSNDALSFNAANMTFSGSSFFEQDGTFFVGNTPGTVMGDHFFSLTDNITIDGVTQSVTINFDDLVTTDEDFLTIAASGPINFGNFTLTIDSTEADGPANTTQPISIVGDIEPVTGSSSSAPPSAVPEPGSLVLLSTGMLAVAGARLRH